MSEIPADKAYLRVSWVANYLDVHPNTILNYFERGILKGKRFPGGWRVETTSLLHFLSKAPQTPQSGH